MQKGNVYRSIGIWSLQIKYMYVQIKYMYLQIKYIYRSISKTILGLRMAFSGSPLLLKRSSVSGRCHFLLCRFAAVQFLGTGKQKATCHHLCRNCAFIFFSLGVEWCIHITTSKAKNTECFTSHTRLRNHSKIVILQSQILPYSKQLRWGCIFPGNVWVSSWVFLHYLAEFCDKVRIPGHLFGYLSYMSNLIVWKTQ